MTRATMGITLVCLVLWGRGIVRAQTACPRPDLPAYAHNDYANAHPLADALAAGYRGVEADVVLIDGVLRVGHDRKQARTARTFEELYLAPLAEIAARCGRLTSPTDRPFLLALEIKDRSVPTYDAVMELLSRYARWLDVRADRVGAPIEVVMVGWYPEQTDSPSRPLVPVKRQQRIAHLGDTLIDDTAHQVRLLSLDYGKTMGRVWTTGGQRQRWLRTLVAASRAAGDRPIRVHNVPVDSVVYRELFAAGVSLIGTKDLTASRPILLTSWRR